MTILVTVLILLAFASLLIFGLFSVLRSLVERNVYAGPVFQDPGPMFQSQSPVKERLDLNLPGNFDHIFGRQIEAIHHFHRVTVEKGEHRQPPAS
jgi:hypothetical protein